MNAPLFTHAWSISSWSLRPRSRVAEAASRPDTICVEGGASLSAYTASTAVVNAASRPFHSSAGRVREGGAIGPAPAWRHCGKYGGLTREMLRVVKTRSYVDKWRQ